MKKTIPFSNDIKFNTNIYEISSISLEHSLKLNTNNLIKGEFLISGDYKITSSSINEEPFIYSLPFDIALDDKYDSSDIEIDIDDFNYEIINEEYLRVNISVLIDGIKLKVEEEIIPDVIINEPIEPQIRNINEIINNNEVEEKSYDLFEEIKEEPKEVMLEKKEIFNDFEEENYVTYYVHIVRGDENIDSICTKYQVTKEDIQKYNSLDNITLGSKIIIPYINESV